MPHDMTQIDLPVELHDRLVETARDLGLLPWGLLRTLLDDYEWSLRVKEAKRAMREASPEVWAEYMEEFNGIDRALGTSDPE